MSYICDNIKYKKMNFYLKKYFALILCLIFFSCQKLDNAPTTNSIDGLQARLSYTKQGFSEVEVKPIVKELCFFSEWNKELMTPVSGLFEYYDVNGNIVASIDFGDGKCDEWATKTWDVNVFPNNPEGTSDFSVFNFSKKKLTVK